MGGWDCLFCVILLVGCKIVCVCVLCLFVFRLYVLVSIFIVGFAISKSLRPSNNFSSFSHSLPLLPNILSHPHQPAMQITEPHQHATQQQQKKKKIEPFGVLPFLPDFMCAPCLLLVNWRCSYRQHISLIIRSVGYLGEEGNYLIILYESVQQQGGKKKKEKQ
jgi:hypothetical protein